MPNRAKGSPHPGFFATRLGWWNQLQTAWGDGSDTLSELMESKKSYVLDIIKAPYNEKFYCTWGSDDKFPLFYHHRGGTKKPMGISAFLYSDVIEEIKTNGFEKWDVI